MYEGRRGYGLGEKKESGILGAGLLSSRGHFSLCFHAS